MSPPRRLILASTSRYRKALLERLGVSFDAMAPDCDETAHPGLGPDALARILAREKATSVAIEDALVIGSDQVVDLDGEVLGKPHTAAAAEAQLRRMAGRSHRLVTAVAVHDTRTGRTLDAVDVHTMTMRALDDARIAAYVAHDAPLDCAGSYLLERRGIALFSRIEADPETADDTAIIGLPLMKTLRLLAEHGYDVLDG
ncbi:MAG: septum formation protein Maf [Deltaproteobacteria bacterium]|nr:MAG: septum formation protein Maf [Deltaproteobacteria bacterium]